MIAFLDPEPARRKSRAKDMRPLWQYFASVFKCVRQFDSCLGHPVGASGTPCGKPSFGAVPDAGLRAGACPSQTTRAPQV